MLISSSQIISKFIGDINSALISIDSDAKLSKIQQISLAFVILATIVTGQLNWALFERKCLGRIKADRMRWILFSSKMKFDLLLTASVTKIISHYNVKSGHLIFDDTDKKRSKKTSKISNVFKMKDKATGGYMNGQAIVFMILVTDTVTFPIGFRFYRPDPVLSKWRKENEKLKKDKIPKKLRPIKPEPNDVEYPKMQALALELIREFVTAFPQIKIISVIADALYGTGKFIDDAEELTKGAQVVSQLRSNQIVSSRNSTAHLSSYFNRRPGIKTQLIIRGGESKPVTMLAARLKVKAHGKRRFIIAIKYENEEKYRYIVASNLSWRHQDIARLYTLRWLVEVFIQDWKAHCGWNKLSKHQGSKGSTRGVILSLLCDHALLLHPEQSARLKNKQPGLPVGCVTEHFKNESLINVIKEVVLAENPKIAFEKLKIEIESSLPDRESSKHMSGKELGRQEETESLARYSEAA